MSAALVRKSLALVDPDLNTTTSSSKRKKKNTKNSVSIPQQHKLIEKIERGGKVDTVNLLKTTRKLTVVELKKNIKPKEEVIKQNIKKLRLLHEACKIELDKEITRQIIERAVTRRPVKSRTKRKTSQKTAFTEEDFKKLEEEYFDE